MKIEKPSWASFRTDAGDIVEALPDPPKSGLTMNQTPIADAVRIALSARIAGRSDAFAGGRGYLCQDARDPEGWVFPDCLVAFGVNPDAIMARNAYVINEIGKPPDFVMDIASANPAVADYKRRRKRYEELQAAEHWLFDPTGGQYYDQPIAGDALVNGRFRPIEIVSGRNGLLWGHSAVLGLDLHWREGMLRLYDPATRRYKDDYLHARLGQDAAKGMLRALDFQRQIERENNLEEKAFLEALHRAAANEERHAERERRLAAKAEVQRHAERERRLAAEAEARRLRGYV